MPIVYFQINLFVLTAFIKNGGSNKDAGVSVQRMKINEGAYFILELILYCAKQVKLNMYTGIAKKTTVVWCTQ